MGFIMHFYIIFGTNILTGGPTQNCCFLPILGSHRKGIPNGMKSSEEVIFGRKATRETWSPRQESNEGGTRQGARPPPWARPTTSWPPHCFLDVHSKSPGLRLFQKQFSRRFHSVWTPFGIPFLRNTKQEKNRNWHWALG